MFLDGCCGLQMVRDDDIYLIGILSVSIRERVSVDWNVH